MQTEHVPASDVITVYAILTWLLHHGLASEFVQILRSAPSVHLRAFRPHFLGSIQSCIDLVEKNKTNYCKIDFYLF